MSKNASGSGSIRKVTKTKNGRQYSYWEGRYACGTDPATGKLVRRSIYGQTQKEVSQKLKAATAAIDRGDYQAPCKLTVGNWLDTWSETYLSSVKPATVVKYRSVIKNHLKPAFGAVKLEALTTPAIQAFLNGIVSGAAGKPPLSPKTAKDVYAVLRRAINKAQLLGYVRSNPCDACELPRITRRELKPLDTEQTKDFLKAIDGHAMQDLFTVMLFTGLREGEALGLRWDCVDFAKGSILVKQQLQREKKKGGTYILVPLKNDRSRVITPATWVISVLKSHRAKQASQRLAVGKAWKDSGFVFTAEDGAHLATHTVYKHFKRLAASIGRPDARVHDLRHSYATAALQNGDDVKTVQGNLGHATASFTLDIYGHLTDQMKRASADRQQQYIERLLQA